MRVSSESLCFSAYLSICNGKITKVFGYCKRICCATYGEQIILLTDMMLMPIKSQNNNHAFSTSDLFLRKNMKLLAGIL